jgi:hypothetical protein
MRWDELKLEIIMNKKLFLPLTLLLTVSTVFTGGGKLVNKIAPEELAAAIEMRGGRPTLNMSGKGIGTLAKLDGTDESTLTTGDVKAVIEEHNVKYLDFSKNKLSGKVGSGLIDKCHKIEIVNLSDNDFTELAPGALNRANALQWIVLNNNKIAKLGEHTFKRVMGLWGVCLAGNRIESVDPKAFANLRLLHSLDLSGNRIKRLVADQFAHIRVYDEVKDPAKAGQPKVEPITAAEGLEIDLSGNPIEEVDELAFANVPQLRKLVMKTEPPLSEDLQAKIMSLAPFNCEVTF